MTIESESIGLAHRAGETAAVGLHPLQQVSHRIGEFRDGRSKLRAKDLVGLLLCHGARAWRSSQPATVVRLKVQTPDRRPAVRINNGDQRVRRV